MRNKYITLLAVIFFCLQILLVNHVVYPAGAQDDESLSSGQRGLSLEECIKLAVNNSFEVKLARLDFLIAETNLSAAEAMFDTILLADAGYSNSNLDQLSIASATETETTTYSAGVSKKIPLGTELALSFSDTKTDSNSAYTLVNPAHTAEIALELRQPLARNVFGYVDRRSISLTGLAVQNADLDSKERIESLFAEVEKTYWEWVFSKRALEIYQGILEKARDLYRTSAKNYDTGLIERGDLLASEANVLIREKDVSLADNRYRRAEENIKLLMNIDTACRIYPKENLQYVKKEINLKDCLQKAFQKRRDYLRAKRSLEMQNIVLETKANERWPEIDLVASMAANGINSKFNKAVNRMVNKNNKEYFAGLKVSMPIENNLARSEFEKAAHGRQEAIIGVKSIERAIITEVGNGFRNYVTYQANLNRLKEAVDLQEEKLKQEEKRFKYGRSNTKRLIDYQQDYLSAELQLAIDILAYKVAAVNLEKTLNIILEKYEALL